jgi:hypothetical protein
VHPPLPPGRRPFLSLPVGPEETGPACRWISSRCRCFRSSGPSVRTRSGDTCTAAGAGVGHLLAFDSRHGRPKASFFLLFSRLLYIFSSRLVCFSFLFRVFLLISDKKTQVKLWFRSDWDSRRGLINATVLNVALSGRQIFCYFVLVYGRFILL